MKKEPTQTISRRSALKRMGLLVAGAAALGVPATLASCQNKRVPSRLLLYFTATGTKKECEVNHPLSMSHL